MTSPGSPVDPSSTPRPTGPDTPSGSGTSASPTSPASPGDYPPRSSGPAPADRTTPSAGRSAGRAIGRTLALALLLFVTVILVLFVVFNTQTVEVSLVFTDVQAPLVLALLIAAALGGLLVWLAGLVARARRRSR